MRLLAIVLIACMMYSCTITKKNQVAHLIRKTSLYYNSELSKTSDVSGATYKYFEKATEAKDKKGKYFYYNDTDNGVLVLLPKDQKDDKVYFFPDKKKEASMAPKELYLGSKLIYWSNKPIYQAISIPFKYRFKTDKSPYDVTTSFNAGFAYGYKFSRNRYRKLYYPNSFSANKSDDVTSEVSFSPAIFAGLTPIALTADNTDKALTANRNVLGGTLGVMGLVGVNKFNLGIALGFDNAFGPYRKDWVYNKKPWLGFVVGFEFVK